MGRELRMVPPNWEHPWVAHPYDGQLIQQPMYDMTFDDAAIQWKRNLDEWEKSVRDERCTRGLADKEYWEYESPPQRVLYRPWQDHEATWFQVWENVTEGTPVSPPFATAQELIEYLIVNGDYWDQMRRRRGDSIPCDPWSREQAEAIVLGHQSAQTLITGPDGVVERGVDLWRRSQ